jgi:hypothetical protein
MLIFRSRAIPLVFILSILFSCKKTTVEGPAGPPGANGTNGNSTIVGTVYGKVALFDSLGKAVADNSGATILFENTSPQISVISATDGSFTSPVLSSGIYNISFSKSGYGTMKLIHFQHTGGGNSSQTGIIEMGKKQSSWFDIKNLKVDTGTDNGWHFMILTVTLTHPQTLPYTQGIMYFSHAPGVGNGSNDYTYRNVFYRVDDSTMSYQSFDQDLTQFSDQFSNINYVYVSVALDNPKLFTYTDSAGNAVYPATGNLSNEVKVYNNLKNY